MRNIDRILSCSARAFGIARAAGPVPMSANRHGLDPALECCAFEGVGAERLASERLRVTKLSQSIGILRAIREDSTGSAR